MARPQILTVERQLFGGIEEATQQWVSNPTPLAGSDADKFWEAYRRMERLYNAAKNLLYDDKVWVPTEIEHSMRNIEWHLKLLSNLEP